MTGMVMKKNIWWRWAGTYDWNGDEEKYPCGGVSER
jgi:hypothetical protein